MTRLVNYHIDTYLLRLEQFCHCRFSWRGVSINEDEITSRSDRPASFIKSARADLALAEQIAQIDNACVSAGNV